MTEVKMKRFRMRPDGNAAMSGVSVNECDQRWKEYLDYLGPLRAQMPGDLWRFFAADFFHDGKMSKLRVSLAHRRIRVDIVCPNVKRFDGSGNFEFVNVAYRVRFTDVWSVAVHADDDDEGPSDVKFYAAEIGAERTEMEAALSARNEPHQSLTVHTSHFWLTIVFGWVAVVPLEEAATELMLASDRYSFPFAR